MQQLMKCSIDNHGDVMKQNIAILKKRWRIFFPQTLLKYTMQSGLFA